VSFPRIDGDLESDRVTVIGLCSIVDDVPTEKALAYMRFLRSEEGRRWREDVELVEWEWDRNMLELHQSFSSGSEN